MALRNTVPFVIMKTDNDAGNTSLPSESFLGYRGGRIR